MKQIAALSFLTVLAFVAADAAPVKQRRLPRPSGEPRAPRISVVTQDEASGAFTPTLQSVLSEAGFEVVPSTEPDAEATAPAATLILRATPGTSPRIVFNGAASRRFGQALHQALPGAELSGVEVNRAEDQGFWLFVDLGQSITSPASQMDAALAVRGALSPLAAGNAAASKAEMTAPAPGSTLSGATATFQWNASASATQYWLMIGTWLGGNTIYSADQGTLTSAPVNGLPTDGRTIYVRLWSYVDGQWVSNDYEYKAFSASGSGPAKADLTAPAPGSTLAGASATFQWNAGTAVTRYYLFIGLWQGGNTIFSQDMGTSLQTSVPNLPTDGSTLHIRLWSYVDTGWQYSDSTVKAAGTTNPAKAAMTGPAPGATLAGAATTFQWNAGSAVSRYFLFVGKWQGGNTLFSQDMGTNLSAAVSGLPTDGTTVYVRLWSYIAGQWQYSDFTYTAAGSAPAGAKAEMTSPAPGSTLTGATANFRWSAGSAVQRYWLFVGTNAGNNDIYGADQSTNTSATVTGLPTNGKVLYVRLWSYINGAWQSNDYSYRASGQ